MVKLIWTEEANNWLKDIYDYISKDNSETASRVVLGIYEHAQILADFPEIGYNYKTVDEGDIRILLYGHYRIAYLIRKNESIDILGVFHGALNVEKYFV